MKRILFFLILLLIPLIANAKLNVEYDYGFYETGLNSGDGYNDIITEGYIKGKFYTLRFIKEEKMKDENTYYFENYLVLNRIDDNGKYATEKKYIIPEEEYFEDVVIYKDKILTIVSDQDDKAYLKIFDEYFELISKTEVYLIDFNQTKKLSFETDDYYYIGTIPIKKETFTPVNIMEELLDSKYGADFTEAETNEEYEEMNRIFVDFLKETYKDSYLPFYFNYNYTEEDYPIYFTNNNDKIITITGDSIYYEALIDHSINIYDFSGNKLKSFNVKSYEPPNVFTYKNSIYVVKYNPDKIGFIDDYYMDIKEEFLLEEFNFDGEMLNKIEISSQINNGNAREYYNIGPRIIASNYGESGFYIKTSGYFSLNAGSHHIQPVTQSIQRFTLNYEVETQTDGNGKIKVSNKSDVDQKVSFEIIPDKGYVLDKVIITDSSGNTLVFNKSSFIMPNADVTIEAYFVPGNPDTATFGTKIILFGIIMVVSAIIFTKRKQKINWLN